MKISKTIIYLLAFGYSWAPEVHSFVSGEVEVTRLLYQFFLLLHDVPFTLEIILAFSKIFTTEIYQFYNQLTGS